MTLFRILHPHSSGIVGVDVPVTDGGSCSVAWMSGTHLFWYCLSALQRTVDCSTSSDDDLNGDSRGTTDLPYSFSSLPVATKAFLTMSLPRLMTYLMNPPMLRATWRKYLKRHFGTPGPESF